MEDLEARVDPVQELRNEPEQPSRGRTEGAVGNVAPSTPSSLSTVDAHTAAGASRPPLVDAAARGDREAVQRLLQNGAHADATDDDGRTALLVATAGGHVAAMEALLEGGADVSIRGPRLRSPLLVAAAGGHLAAVQLLLKWKADENSKDTGDNSVLHVAAAEGHKDVVAALLQIGADIHVKNAEGNSALHLAAAGGHKDVVTALLLQRTVHVDQKNAKGNRAPLVAAPGHKDIAAALLQRGVNILVNNQGKEYILRIVRPGTNECILPVLLWDAEIDSFKNKIRLIYERYGESVWWLVDSLVKKGTGLCVSRKGECEFLLACQHGNLQVVRFLLQCKVRVTGNSCEVARNVRVAAGLNVAANGAVVWALASSYPELLWQREGEIALSYAARDGRLSALKALLEGGVNPCAMDDNQHQALYLAAAGGHVECCNALLGATVDTTTQNSMLNEALYTAALYNKVSALKILLGF